MVSKELVVCHLYGNLLNTYGDNGNLLMLKYLTEKMGVTFRSEFIISEDIQNKKEALTSYIENDGVLLAICGGYQLLGHYYVGAQGEKIKGIGALDHYTLSQDNNRFIGDIEIYNEEFDETYYGFENHNGMTFLGEGERPLGTVKQGKGNNGQDNGEGVVYKNVFGSYFHGPILARNKNLGIRLIRTALEKKYGEPIAIPETLYK